ncbi:hypothetical protein [Rhodanobacter sp. Soil772]|uniref:DUF6988 family protein n=1 Tax=Rhodanobacter sp. Soil772 TaxID=1736406 RepID=UPI000AE8F8C1|nr:hypothetical protein [Rhodanobacter sp. Soil772]
MEELLIRSEAFAAHLDELIDGAGSWLEIQPRRTVLSALTAAVSLEHAAAIRLTIDAGKPNSATALTRLQYEALLRSVWLLFIANEEQLDKLASPLSAASQQAAKNMPGIAEILRALEKSSVPDELKRLLSCFYQASAPALNSFVHGGIHPLQRSAAGYPVELARQVVKQSNMLLHTTYRLLAHMIGSAELMKQTTDARRLYEDCLSFKAVEATETSSKR